LRAGRDRDAPAIVVFDRAQKYEDFFTLIRRPGDRNMKLSYSSIVLAVVLTFPQASAKTEGEANNQPTVTSRAESPSLKVGESFLVARRRIVRSGWHPTRMHSNDDYEYSGAEKELADHQFAVVK
jgi:hypothetical protein